MSTEGSLLHSFSPHASPATSHSLILAWPTRCNGERKQVHKLLAASYWSKWSTAWMLASWCLLFCKLFWARIILISSQNEIQVSLFRTLQSTYLQNQSLFWVRIIFLMLPLCPCFGIEKYRGWSPEKVSLQVYNFYTFHKLFQKNALKSQWRHLDWDGWIAYIYIFQIAWKWISSSLYWNCSSNVFYLFLSFVGKTFWRCYSSSFFYYLIREWISSCFFNKLFHISYFYVFFCFNILVFEHGYGV